MIKNVPRQERLCKSCNVLDDEFYFFLSCGSNSNLRTLLFDKIKNHHYNLFPNFQSIGPSKNHAIGDKYIMFAANVKSLKLFCIPYK